jgi:sugar/nucleoside kinase (ribokinase family)
MKVLVIGHFCLDAIHSRGGEVTKSYGGIYYSLAGLAGLLGPEDVVLPVFGVNARDHGPLVEHLSGFGNIDCSGIFRFDEPTNLVELFYHEAASRKEQSRHIAKPIPFQNIRRYLSVDGVLVNMISGFDIELETLDNIRMAVRDRRIPIHFDFHSLTLGVDASNGRFRRPVPEWRRWAFMMETVQLNEEEIGGLPPDRMSEEQTAGHLLTLGARGVIVTRGSAGATVYRNEKKHVVREDIPAASAGEVKDTTGCGDLFGAAFLVSYLNTRDLTESASFGNAVAASRLGETGSARLRERMAALAPGLPKGRKRPVQDGAA